MKAHEILFFITSKKRKKETKKTKRQTTKKTKIKKKKKNVRTTGYNLFTVNALPFTNVMKRITNDKYKH